VSVHPNATLGVLRDMDHQIGLAIQFVEGMSFDEFEDDIRTLYAVTRCLEIISEASRRLPLELKERHPPIAWKNMAGAGNIYRHDYEEVGAKILWDTVQLALPPLQAVVAAELARLQESI
jgi:uncharacterized protein with HEPN domain